MLAIISGLGLGFPLGIQFILYQQKKGKMTPLTPFSLPVIGQLEEEKKKVTKNIEEGSVNKIKTEGKPPEEPKYI